MSTTIVEMLVRVASILMTTTIFVISNTITIVQYSNAEYPQITQPILALVGLYVSYRFTKRIITSWLNMVVFMVKMFLLLITIIVGLAAYLRGERFFSQDIPFLQQAIQEYNGEAIQEFVGAKMNQAMFSNLFSSFGDSEPEKKTKTKTKKPKVDKGKKFQKKAKRVMKEHGIEIDSSYLDYLNENLGYGGDENILDNVGAALDGLGLDVSGFMDRFHV
ncbi:hypothetical protein PSN45_001705 [Yamadazyma tenuis]|uniref:Uncharacterized protein n=1 Tax=Candida tenuis (strain ATCC 10573 / BCRC 21748 / CBS 615 / JCM 9827 / NBRC 10315 / NRRL Y-1498 / VKM Y-70) TaxID=590646 RepID=G3BEF8_CANTC|nr:uncharacterized protein CANTEDRAFT_95984 [Yamadazyma tenuis ATCC 10573]EGV60535.1 hypothetical protein CANTEDRAFT_95984 [Yamadazyma tenuis ATCC 10573]WEJ94224.1 hypothetical protein PSN45_001705 [Yamadazyma tenuis]